MKLWEKIRADRQHEKTKKLRQKELDRQRQEEAERFQKLIDDPSVSREEALSALHAWLDKWMDE